MGTPNTPRRTAAFLFLFAALALSAASLQARSFTFEFSEIDAVEPSDPIELKDHLELSVLTVQVETAGSPTTCTVYLEGKQDERTGWVKLNNSSPADCATNANLAIVIVGQVWRYVRLNVTALSGGSSPTVNATLEAGRQ